jgi:hypothetical protein
MFLWVRNISVEQVKTNTENDCAFANLEEKCTFIIQIIKVKDMCVMYLIAPLDIIYKHLLSSSYFIS